MARNFHALTITDVRHETPDAVSIAFAVPEKLRRLFDFVPGQYLTLKTEVGKQELRRTYSICSGLDEGELRVAVKQVDGGRFSAFANSNLAPGQAIEVMPPLGAFGIAPDPAAQRVYVGLACGSGITPILSIIKSMLEREPQSRFILLYGNRTTASILFREALDDLKDRYLDRLSIFHVLSRELQDLEALNGRLDGDKIALLLGRLIDIAAIDHVFVCGPGSMPDESLVCLQALGIPAERIHLERFTPTLDGAAPAASVTAAAAKPAQPAAEAEITLDGSRHRFPVAAGESVVDAALRAGLELPYSCRGGMCCTCRAKIVEGSAEMVTNYSLEPWEIEAGFTLTCQARPTSPRLVLDYDQV